MSGHAYRGTDVPELREPSVIESWRARDPIEAFERALIADGTLSAGDAEAVRQSITRELDGARRFAEASPYPDLDEALEGMFA